ncbi:Translation initiation factor 3 subunit J component [Cryptotrichosporon argae]
MSDDWDLDDDVAQPSAPAPAALPARPAAKKWAGEDEDDGDDDWDKSDTEEKKKAAAAPAAKAAPATKKMSLKQKLAEKERLAAEARARGDTGNDLMDEMTEQERRRLAREKELEADMAVAADLLGGATLEDRNDAIKAALTATATTKADFAALASQVYTAVVARHAEHPLFAVFAEQLAKEICEPLSAVQTRKVASALGVVGNTKQQEERDKASGKKKAPAKPKLGATKALVQGKVDTEAYDDVLDDDDFM